jgi:hypothetical protein
VETAPPAELPKVKTSERLAGFRPLLWGVFLIYRTLTSGSRNRAITTVRLDLRSGPLERPKVWSWCPLKMCPVGADPRSPHRLALVNFLHTLLCLSNCVCNGTDRCILGRWAPGRAQCGRRRLTPGRKPDGEPSSATQRATNLQEMTTGHLCLRSDFWEWRTVSTTANRLPNAT